ncbi:MAG: putative sporulation protein YtxC [Peptococcaceae bacterium]|nr:putative sporulation protein YtxC [Peptococcaceae bacterium]
MAGQKISIGASNYIDLIRTRLAGELKQLEGYGLKFDIKENLAGKLTFLSCSVTRQGKNTYSEEDDLSLFKNHVANVLSDLIVCNWQKAMLVEIIRENYYYFGEEDRRTILQNALRYLEEYEGDQGDSMLRLRKKSKILAKLKDFLGAYNQIVIEGFIRFRLKEYIQELQEAADKAVDDFLMDREYKEFIQLLKYFVDIQDSRTDVVNVVIKPDGVFKLYDGQHRVINGAYPEGLIFDLVESEINYEDLLISALITIAPREIIFHTGGAEGPPNTLETINNIFSQRVTLCRGCELCNAKRGK